MTQEDKAKAYDELIEDIKRIIFNHEGGELYNLLGKQGEEKLSNSAYTSNKSITEFANNYSHMIWEKLMDKFNKIENYSIGCNDVSDIVLNAIINTYNWLEKQNEQKPIDKIKLKPEGKSTLDAINEENDNNANIVGTNNIKPKFKIGYWIINKVNNSVAQIIGYKNNNYCIKKPDCIYYELLSVIDETYRLWHITDAKPGDIVVTKNGNIFIFKGIQDCVVYDYCGLYYGKIDIHPSNVNESCAKELPINYNPATKEQRDLLIKKLNDAGYTFDFDKKELNKISEVDNTNKKVTLHPFDKVLARDTGTDYWVIDFFQEKHNNYVELINECYNYCIPYNKDTAHLLGTTDDCPIKYELEFSKEFKEK